MVRIPLPKGVTPVLFYCLFVKEFNAASVIGLPRFELRVNLSSHLAF